MATPEFRHGNLLNHTRRATHGPPGKKGTLLVMKIVKQPYMKNKISIALVLLIALTTAACSIHKVDIQQGNIVSKEMMSQLTIGMTQDEIKRVMGSPLIVDPFRRDRWDYIHSFKSGKSNQPRTQYRITLFFEGDQLARIESEIPPEGLPER